MIIQRQARWLVTDLAQLHKNLRHADVTMVTMVQDWFLSKKNSDDLGDYIRVRKLTSHSSRGHSGETVITSKLIVGPGVRHIARTTLRDPKTFLESLGDAHIVKTRKQISPQITFDVYEKPNGLMIVEWNDPPENVSISMLPDWLHGCGLVDVTDSITSAHIANLPPLNNNTDPIPYLQDQIAKKIPMIVLTGGPCSGKSTALRVLAEDPRFHVVPEAASILIAQLGIKPVGDDGHSDRFQIAHRRVQMIFEALARSQARADGKKVVILDRGTVDAAAYIPGGIAHYGRCFGVEALNDARRYHAVVQIAVPPSEIYEAHQHNNPARREDYTQAKALETKIVNAWKSHPNYTFVDDLNWQTKLDTVISCVNDYLP